MVDIKNYEGRYAITSCGRVWSYRSKKFLIPQKSKSGYWHIGLYKDGERKNFLLHRLVTEAYLDNPDNLPEVNHKDECKDHNYLGNLEWCDRKYNMNYGERNRKPVYCVELGKTFESITEAAHQLGLDLSSVSACCRGRLKTTGGLHFEFVQEGVG